MVPTSKPLLDTKAFLLILLFTAIELLTLTVWLDLLGFSLPGGFGQATLAAGVLFLGLLVEHTVATIAGKV